MPESKARKQEDMSWSDVAINHKIHCFAGQSAGIWIIYFQNIKSQEGDKKKYDQEWKRGASLIQLVYLTPFN